MFHSDATFFRIIIIGLTFPDMVLCNLCIIIIIIIIIIIMKVILFGV